MASNGTELAKAYVQIIPSAQGIKEKLEEIFGKEAEPTGKSAGISIADGIKKAIAAAGIGQAIKSALNVGADLQQNVGGIETLFKTSSDKVIESAYNAYKTAGLSANEYMETVTGFSASLLQGLAGDTEKASSVADMALVDMADNANKMGSSMELIQNAYQGFAKQNYTMLDNLKLGYGGTKEEMERLLADAKAFSGVEYSIDNLSDVYNAIHVIQGELGISGRTAEEAAAIIERTGRSSAEVYEQLGTTAKEAASTLSGSGAAMKSAFNNVLGQLALGEDIRPALNGLTETVSVYVKDNLIPMLGNILVSIPEVVGTAMQGAIDGVPYATELISSFASGIGENLPELVPQALEMIATLADTVIENIPTIVSAGGELIKGLVKGVINSIPLLITEGPRIINDFADAIYSGIGELLKLGLEMIVSLVKGIWYNRELILENAGEIFMAFINVFSLSNLFSLGQNLVTNLDKGITKLFSSIKKTGGDLLKTFVEGIKNRATDPITVVKTIVNSIKSVFTNIKWSSIGKNVISGIVNGLKAGVGSIISAAKDAAMSAFNSAKEALDIHSPSRKFDTGIGKMIDLGLAGGIKKNVGVVRSAMKTLSAATVGMINTDINVPNNTYSASTTEYNNQLLVTMQQMRELLEYLPMLAHLKVVMDTGETVGALAPGMDEALGIRAARAERMA